MTTRLLSTQRVVNLSSDPASGTSGEIYFNTVDSELKVHDGSAWSPLAGGGGGGALVVSESAPESPTSGQLWYSSSNARTYVYYEDGSSNQWIEIGSATISPTGNYDGGMSNSIYGGVTGIDGGGAT